MSTAEMVRSIAEEIFYEQRELATKGEGMELYELRNSVELALDIVHATRAILAAEVCASWCEQQVVQLRHDTEHPSEDLQALQSHMTYGLSFLVVMADSNRRTVGFGVTSEDLSREAILAALETAKQGAVPEPLRFVFPRPLDVTPPPIPLYDAQVLTLPDDEIKQVALEALDGALSTLQEAGYIRGLRVSGEVRSQKEHLVIGNTQGLLVSDTTTGLLATMSVQLTRPPSQGAGSRAATHWRDFTAADAGVEAAQQALRAQGAITLAGGDYPVVFGPRAVAALLQDLLLPALSLDTVAAGTSPFATQRNQSIASPLLTLIDDGRLPGMLGSRTITGDGLPTGATTLIEQGRLVDFLADAYHAQHLTGLVGAVVPRHGMRHATNGQSFAMRPGIFPTNVTCASPEAVAFEALLAPIDQGLYVDNLWQITTPDGLRTGVFASTVIGASFTIRQGKLAETVRPGTLSLQDNFLDLLQRLTGISTTQQPVVLATRQSLVRAPEWRCSQAHFVANVPALGGRESA
jgi:PmbA protein